MEATRLHDRPRSGRRLTPADRVTEFRGAAAEIAALADDAAKRRDLALASIHAAMEARLKVGLRLLELNERFAGDFDGWLDGYCKDLFSRATAYRWMAKVRDLKVALGKDEPTFEELKKAQQAAETLPEAIGSAGNRAEPPPFRLRLEIPSDIEKWEPLVRREFLVQAKQVVELYHRVMELERNAA